MGPNADSGTSDHVPGTLLEKGEILQANRIERRGAQCLRQQGDTKQNKRKTGKQENLLRAQREGLILVRETRIK